MTGELNTEQRMRQGEARQINAEGKRRGIVKYGDDQCVQCGGIRVAKSTLCADCLVALCQMEGQRRMEMKEEIELLKGQITRDRGRLEDAVHYGFKKNQEFDLLLRSHKRLEDMLEEVRKDEKNGISKH